MPSFGETLLRFSAGFENPAGAFAAQQKIKQEQQELKRTTAQFVLQNLPANHPAAAKAQQSLVDMGMPGLGQAISASRVPKITGAGETIPGGTGVVPENMALLTQGGKSSLVNLPKPDVPKLTTHQKNAAHIAGLEELVKTGKASDQQKRELAVMTRLTSPNEPTTRFDLVTAINPAGDVKRARWDPIEGILTDEQGNQLPEGFVPFKSTVTAASAEGITGTQQGKRLVELGEDKIRTDIMIATSNRVIELAKKDPLAFTSGARFAATVDTLWVAAQSMVSAMGIPLELSHDNPLDYPDEFWGELVNASDEAKQLAFTQALQTAATNAIGLGTGKALSDKDVKLALEIPGTEAQRAQRVIRNQETLQRTAMEAHAIRSREIRGEDVGVYKDELAKFGVGTKNWNDPNISDEEVVRDYVKKLLERASGTQ